MPGNSSVETAIAVAVSAAADDILAVVKVAVEGAADAECAVGDEDDEDEDSAACKSDDMMWL